ncbi:MAG: transglutaminaseTgpA domain-containing protein [Rubrobacteraceae bacterium]|nr:transglutaminaseTgpA domain-containing protein [Rubrobacteraceae bacterium]
MVRSPRLIVPLYAACAATGASFSVLFTGRIREAGGGLLGLTGSAFLLLVGAALTGALAASVRRRWIPLTVVAGTFYTLVSVYGFPPVTPSGWKALGIEVARDLYAAAGTMYLEKVPYDLAPGLFVIFLPLVVLLGATATATTLRGGSPVLSMVLLGLSIGVVSTVSFEDGIGPYFAAFLVCAVLLVTAGSPGRARGDSGGDELGRGEFVAALAVAGLVLAIPRLPLLGRLIRPGLVDWTKLGTSLRQTSRLSAQADVGNYLSAGREARLMKVRSTRPLFWRGGTLDHFDGFRWTNTIGSGERTGPDVAPGVQTEDVYQGFEILDAQTNLVFGGYEIVETSVPGARRRADGSWYVENTLQKGTYYRVLSKVPQPTASQLRLAGTDYPRLVREKYLQLPDGLPGNLVRVEKEILRRYGPRTPYDKARAVYSYLKYDGGFTYNLNVNYKAGEELQEFLSRREGFCTQFSSTMALICRKLGVPTRNVYGATTGQMIRPGEYLVRGENMHTWVEVYFPGVGWYPFDPTPGFTVTTTMDKNAPAPHPSLSSVQDQIPNSPGYRRQLHEAYNGPSQESSKGKKPQARSSTPHRRRSQRRSGGQEAGSLPWEILPAILVALLAASPLSKRALVRGGTPEALYRDLVGRLEDVLPPGRARGATSPSLTPTERLRLLAAEASLDEEPFEEFAALYSGYLYGGGAGADRHEIARAYRRALRAFEEVPRWRRVVGFFNPTSLVYGAGGSARRRLGGLLKKTLPARLRRAKEALRRALGR